MDFDPYTQMAEENAFEEEYAAEMEMLNETENTSTVADAPKSSQGCRRLFGDDEPGPSTSIKHSLSYEDDFDDDLIIDEECGLTMPASKRSKMEFLPSRKSHSLPTTLDEDLERLKMRKEREKDLRGGQNSPDMIRRILEFRDKKLKDSDEFFNQRVSKDASDVLQIRKVLAYPPVHRDFVSATSTDGQRCYMRIRDQEPLSHNANINARLHGKSLLLQSVSEMRQAICLERESAVLKEAHQITSGLRQHNILDSLPAVPEDSESAQINEAVFNSIADVPDAQNLADQLIDESDSHRHDSSKNGLWLDKFAPTQYTHLLSEENTNRSLLKWLKMWDFVVFGRALQKKTKQEPNNNNTKKSFFAAKKEFEEKTDEYNRPFFKASLLYGPPGLGKTTLAHIIAKHAGYHVVEMNASDDRSAELFKKKLEETTQMKSVLGQDERPNCLIIDEIDGAPQAAIDVLLTAMNKTRKRDEKNIGKKKRNANNILLRPIICICNDLYVPALRQLRQQSLLLSFSQTQSTKLASRLAQLCRLQSLRCDLSTLLRLCEKTDNDIRSCVNTLQFVKASGQQKLSTEAVDAFQIGQKDQHRSIFRVWQEIFQLPKNRKATEKSAESTWISGQTEELKSSAIASRFQSIFYLVSANGDYEKTFQGVHENYLAMRFKDHDLACINKAQEWIQFYDRLSAVNQHLQDWSVMKFYPYLFVLFHMMFSCVNVPKIKFPTQSFEAVKNRQKSDNLLKSLYLDMAPATQCYASSQTAVVDSIPYILTVMTPSLRPVNIQLYTAAEKAMLHDLVKTMISYNLSFQQRRNEDGQYYYALEPNVSEICGFVEGQDRLKLPYSTRQLIAKEVEMERMRRSEHLLEGPSSQMPSKPAKATTTVPAKPSLVKNLENSSTPLPKEKPVVDFFSRFTKVKKIVEVGGRAERKKETAFRDPGIGNSQIWYKFNEGYSNAVRQTVYVKDFL